MNTNPFVTFYRGLSEPGRKQYADAAGTTVNYIETHLVCSPPRKVPRPKLMARLAEASDGKVTQEDLFRHFYQPRRHPSRPASSGASRGSRQGC